MAIFLEVDCSKNEGGRCVLQRVVKERMSALRSIVLQCFIMPCSLNVPILVLRCSTFQAPTARLISDVMAFLVCTHQCVGAWMCWQVVLFTHHPQNRTFTTRMVAKDATGMISFFANATQSGFPLNEQAAMQDSQEGDGPFWTQ